MKQAQTGEWRTMRSIYWTRRWSTQVVESAARWKRWWSKFSAYGPGLPAIDQQGHQH